MHRFLTPRVFIRRFFQRIAHRLPPALLALAIASAARADVLELGDGGHISSLAADARPAAVAPGALRQVPTEWLDALHDAARRHAVSPQLLEALVWQESRWRADARSPKGALGLTQLMPQTARELGVDPLDPRQNLEGGARYLRRQLDRFGALPLALAAYNAGPERVAAAGGIPPLAETRGYVDAVLLRLGRSTFF